MKKTWVFIFLSIIFLAFFFKASVFLDPDFGWHYQMGNLITESGIPKLDPFSYTKPSFEFVDHEWLTNVLIYKIHLRIGYIGMAIIWSLLMIAVLYISIFKINVSKAKNIVKTELTKATVVAIGAGLFIHQFGVRPQVISWLFISVLLWVLGSYNDKPKIKYLIPLLFLVWANMHGMFVLGIVTLSISLSIKSIIKKQIDLTDASIFFTSLVLTFINPYGVNLWKEVFSTFFDYSSRMQIMEWRPVWTRLNLVYPLICVSALTLIYRYRKLFKPESIVLFLMLMGMSVNSLISLPLFGVIALPVLFSGLFFLKGEAATIKFGKKRFDKILKVFFGISIGLYVFAVSYSMKEAFEISEDQYYPKDAIGFISTNLPSGQIFAPFNWGGYLIWKIPIKKVFVDGRMVHWDGILDYQTQILDGDINYIDVFDKYNIQMIVWPNGIFKQAFINKIKQDGWAIIYSDMTAVVFEKKSKD